MPAVHSAKRSREIGFGIVIALASTGGAIMLRVVLAPGLAQQAPLLILVLGVVLSTMLGGFVGGIVATAASALAGTYFFLQPPGWAISTTSDQVRLGLFVCVGILISFLGGRSHRMAKRLSEAIEELSRKQAALRESEERLRLFVEHAPVAIAMFDREMRYMISSARWREDYGLTEKLAGLSNHGVFPEIPMRWKEVHRRALEGEVIRAEEDCFARADGTTNWQRWETRPWYDAFGGIGGIVILTEDITARKTAEQALQKMQHDTAESLGLLETLLAHAPVGIGMITPEFRYLRINDALAAMNGLSVNEVLGRHPAEVVSGLWPALEPIYRRVMAGEAIADVAISGKVPPGDGKTKHWLASYYPVYREGKILGAGVIVRDVTEAKRIQDELQDRERLLALATSHARVGLIVLDQDYRYLFANDAYAEMTGIPTGEIVGKRLPDVFERAWECSREQLERAFTGERVHFELEVPPRVDGASLEGRTFVVTYEPSTNAKENAPGQRNVVAVIMDISERKRAENALRDSDRRKDEFLAMLAHELRNPLSPVKSAVQILGLKQPENGRSAQLLRIIDRQVDHLARMIDDLLDISRLSRGRITLQREPIALATVVRHALEVSQSFLDRRQHALRVNVPAKPIFVFGDRVRLVQVFANLLNNACKYTDPGGRIHLDVAEECSNGQSEAVVRVGDTGRGIEVRDLPHVFDMFYQAERSIDRSEGGLGIGLSLVRQLVELHGGTVQASSKGLGHGSEFIVRLPIHEFVVTPREAEVPAPSHRRRRALVVDDNVDAAVTMAMVLETFGHEVSVIHDGRLAVGEAERNKPDVVLLDIGLPGIDGYEVCRRLRERFGRTMRIIAITGYGQATDRHRASEIGFDEYLVKPATMERIRVALQGD